ncbi:energy-coupling factor ABC transporter ATP-binding protein [Microbacterium sp. EYE_5]|uniref:ABC transporter ATP-binding protein n=1 Tax=unclassified Microbacterium TaxID=2609290 RepID=UPI002005B24F|nr:MULTISPECIES: ABC transporter ATP-binding protein [unclassified Microbacterium]MCK6079220.1 energy-coupling factor ABC transporter ATP-binding protein [Microbacterium sp. EYE_382]MCK6084490.1 energy-coupling factor ABC transporter ATP-binding protein [Microbacterium sp. EYE_384]MCK6123281.1 energy-coupling factor ABC transporter ATP-binding protein [Microbacterium sp. EYE_80]MCK6125254.1 energy-coupling factor ABC transporter ATP-binding protein [Microbacterium sp. EYE_79]MCK6140174.1 energ
MTQPAAVEVRSWGWRHASRRAWAVRGVDLTIAPGERVLLLGASGAGKSTLLHGLAGVLGGADEGESEGTILLDGDAAAAGRGRAGLVLQDPDSQVILARVGDDVAFGCENLGVPRDEIWPRVDAALVDVGLDVPRHWPTKELSGGQKQRLALAGVVAMQPGLVLLDEPTANLDPDGVVEVRDAVARLLDGHGTTLVVVEHRVDVWLPVVDRVVVLVGGGSPGVIADGRPAEILGVHGEQLARAGIWVPGHPPREPGAPASAPGELLLSARDLAVQRVAGHPIADGIDLDVRAGEILAVTGPNGAGKSTLGLTLAGLLPPASGELRAQPTLANGIGARPIDWSSRELLTRIGTVFQEPEHQFLSRTVRAELEVGPRALGMPAEVMDRIVNDLLRRMRLDHLAAANPYTLSGGEQRRLTVASMLATAPRVLILDEPTFGQDSTTWASLVALLSELRDGGSAIVVVTHDLDAVRALHAREFRLRGRP